MEQRNAGTAHVLLDEREVYARLSVETRLKLAADPGGDCRTCARFRLASALRISLLGDVYWPLRTSIFELQAPGRSITGLKLAHPVVRASELTTAIQECSVERLALRGIIPLGTRPECSPTTGRAIQVQRLSAVAYAVGRASLMKVTTNTTSSCSTFRVPSAERCCWSFLFPRMPRPKPRPLLGMLKLAGC